MLRRIKTVFGKNLTKHHNELIDGEVQESIELFIDWFHEKGFEPVKHIPWKPRRFKLNDEIWPEYRIYHAFKTEILDKCQEK